jgi:hypothetical protein
MIDRGLQTISVREYQIMIDRGLPTISAREYQIDGGLSTISVTVSDYDRSRATDN